MGWVLQEITVDDLVGPPGPEGPPGEDGEAGEPGIQGPAGDLPMVWYQAAAAAEWTIPHTRTGRPDVVLILESAPTERVFTDVDYPDDATVVVTWPSPEAGWAYVG